MRLEADDGQLDFSEKTGIPVIATEQYPRAFGRLVGELRGVPPAVEGSNAPRVSDCKRVAVFEKTKFSMLEAPVGPRLWRCSPLLLTRPSPLRFVCS